MMKGEDHLGEKLGDKYVLLFRGMLLKVHFPSLFLWQF